MVAMDENLENGRIPLELTAPDMQALIRKGLAEPLNFKEQLRLCECVAFHVDAILDRRRIPRLSAKRPGSHRQPIA